MKYRYYCRECLKSFDTLEELLKVHSMLIDNDYLIGIKVIKGEGE